MTPTPCHYCNMFVDRDDEGRFYATSGLVAEPWVCPSSASGHLIVTPKPEYPEHAKLTAIADQTQAIGEFIEWLESKGIFLARYVEGRNYPRHVHGFRALLAEWAGIDEKKLEAEKRQMLANLTTAAANGG